MIRDDVKIIVTPTGVSLKEALTSEEINSSDISFKKWNDYESIVIGEGLTIDTLEGRMKADIGDYSDWEMIDGKHYCPDCYEVEVIDGVYNVKAKEK